MRTLIMLVMGLAGAACGSSAPTPITPATGTQPELAAPRPTPPPTIAFADGGFVLHGFPAIAAAGEIVVVAIQDPSHEDANLRVEIRGADDRIVKAVVVLTRAESATLVTDRAASPALAARIAALNAELVTMHGVHDLRVMRPLAVEAGHGGEDQHWATGDNLDVEWREHHIRLFRHNSTQALLDHDGATWAAPPTPACVGRNEAFLGGAYHAEPGTVLAAAGNTVVVDIAYRGDDTCEAPGHRPHVLSWIGAR